MSNETLAPQEVRQVAAYLRTHKIWRQMPTSALEKLLAARAAVCVFAKGAPIWGGDVPFVQAMGLVLAGFAQVRKEHLLLSVHRPGDYFGLATLYNSEGHYPTEIVAAQPCRVLFLPKEAIDDLLKAYPAVATDYIAYLSQRVYYLNGRLDALTAGSAARRLECHLRAAAVMDEQGRLVCAVPSQTALAQAIGMGRASLYRALETLARAGVISREGKGIVLL
ncbi:MAG: Crp/Fnr family transcriptional regulator [Oscillospiraceae bacterium]|jgi:CRP-like cAMP-binding protein|nr:Crp/Fnr family transcriptional regulator [Oscillospiraceae bacterium]